MLLRNLSLAHTPWFSYPLACVTLPIPFPFLLFWFFRTLFMLLRQLLRLGLRCAINKLTFLLLPTRPLRISGLHPSPRSLHHESFRLLFLRHVVWCTLHRSYGLVRCPRRTSYSCFWSAVGAVGVVRQHRLPVVRFSFIPSPPPYAPSPFPQSIDGGIYMCVD